MFITTEQSFFDRRNRVDHVLIRGLSIIGKSKNPVIQQYETTNFRIFLKYFRDIFRKSKSRHDVRNDPHGAAENFSAEVLTVRLVGDA